MTTCNINNLTKYVNKQSCLELPSAGVLSPNSNVGIDQTPGNRQPSNIELSGRPGMGSRERATRGTGFGSADICKADPVPAKNPAEHTYNNPLCSTVAIPPIMAQSFESEVLPPLLAHTDIIVGYNKLRQLLQPKHSYFNDKQVYINEFASYKHSEEDTHSLLFARVKGKSAYATKNNPYRKYQLARTHSGRTISQIAGVIESNELGDFRIACISWTIPSDISEALAELGPKKGQAVIKSAFKKLANEDIPAILGISGVMGSLNNLHVWSTNEPLKPHYHIHSILPNYHLVGARVFNGKLDGGEFIKWFGKGLEKHYGTDPVTGKKKYGPVAFSVAELVKLKIAWIVRLKAACKRNKIVSPYLDSIDMDGKWSGEQVASMIDVHVHFEAWKEGSSKHKFINKINYQKRHWIEDYAVYSNKNTDCAVPPEWLEKYNNRSIPLGWWCNITEYGGTPEKDGERISPFTAGKMVRNGITTCYGVMNHNNGIVGGMAIIRGRPVAWKLCQDDLQWLAKVSYSEFTLDQLRCRIAS